MSSPLTGGGQSFVLQPGQPVLLTEYAAGPDAPLLIINTSSAQVYLAQASGVSTASGVPVAGGTSLPWATAGQVWAMLDPAASGTATVVITGAATDWQPSPYVIAGAVAAQLLASGVPNVLREDEIWNGFLAGNAQTEIAISQYASLSVVCYSGAQLSLVQLDPSGNVLDVETFDGLASPADVPVRLAAIGATLRVINLTGSATAPFQIFGSNRPALARADTRRQALAGQLWSLPGNTYTAGQNATMQIDPGVPNSRLQGQVFASFRVPSAFTKFHLQIVEADGPISGMGGAMVIATSGEFLASDTAGELALTKMIAVPGVSYVVQFTTQVAVTAGAINVWLMPCQV